jgi:hypothetical protein
LTPDGMNQDGGRRAANARRRRRFSKRRDQAPTFQGGEGGPALNLAPGGWGAEIQSLDARAGPRGNRITIVSVCGAPRTGFWLNREICQSIVEGRAAHSAARTSAAACACTRMAQSLRKTRDKGGALERNRADIFALQKWSESFRTGLCSTQPHVATRDGRL